MNEMKSSNIEAKENLIELQVSLASVERYDAIYILIWFCSLPILQQICQRNAENERKMVMEQISSDKTELSDRWMSLEKNTESMIKEREEVETKKVSL